MKFKSLLLITLLLPTLAMASGSYYTLNANAPVVTGQPPVPITIKPSPPPNQQPKNNAGGPQGTQNYVWKKDQNAHMVDLSGNVMLTPKQPTQKPPAPQKQVGETYPTLPDYNVK
jgi:hypothetical protein